MDDVTTLLHDKKKLSNTSKPTTVSCIAKAMGLSPSTVSFVLSGQAKKRRVSSKTACKVMKVAKEMQYVPNMWAQNLKRQRTGVVMILLGGLEHSWAQCTIVGAEKKLNEAGYNYIISIHHWDHGREEQELELLLKRKDEGVICQPVLSSKENYCKVVRHNVPLVLLDILPDMPAMSYVTWDSGPAARTVVEHLVSTGRRRIGFVGTRHYSLMTTARHHAYQRTLLDAGFEVMPQRQCWDLVVGHSSTNLDGYSDFTNTKHLQKMIEKEKLDALFCLNDGVALEVMQLLHRLDIRVPEDIAVAGMGNLPISHNFAVGLTTIHEPTAEIGQVAAEVLLELIDNPNSGPIQKLIKSNDLKIRRSTVG